MAKKPKWDGSAPFGQFRLSWDSPEEYGMISYPEHRHKPTWVEQRTYVGVVTVEDLVRGRSAANFTVYVSPHGGKSTDIFLPFRATLFMRDFLDAVAGVANLSRNEQGQLVLWGVWTHCKRGQNYGIKLCPTP